MIREKIQSHEGVAALLLSDEILKSAGLRIGDEIDITVADGTLTLRPAHEDERKQSLNMVVDVVISRRRDAYRGLTQKR